MGAAVGFDVGANEGPEVVGTADGTYVTPVAVYVRDGRMREMRGRETVSERERA